MIKGRRDMGKVIMEKKVKKKREVDIKVDNDEEKYLNGEDTNWISASGKVPTFANNLKAPFNIDSQILNHNFTFYQIKIFLSKIF